MIRWKLILYMLMLSLAQGIAFAGDLQSDLEQALDRLEEGTRLLESHDERSDVVLDESAAMLLGVIEQYGVETPGIYHALGNANMLKGDLGHAVLAYRKGQQLDPTDPRLNDSLAFARAQVPLSIEPNTSSRIWSALLIWRGYIPRGVLWIGFVVLFTAGWLVQSARLLNLAPRRLGVLGVWSIVLSLVPGALLGIEWSRTAGSNHAVIVGSHVIARAGPDDAIYDPVYTDGLVPGIEVHVLESRDGWDRIELADGSESWVPETSIEHAVQ